MEPGQTLSHFRILGKIGGGGMGVVYKAEDSKLRRPVALKVLPPNLVGDKERRLRFLREARVAAAATHPNIATIHEVDEVAGIVFIAMEYIEGKTLRHSLADKSLTIQEALRIASEMAEGLASAHEAHIIHRDLKPENVMVRLDGHIKILDFGLAKLLEEQMEASLSGSSHQETVSAQMTHEGRILGTYAYMSPEQARGKAVDARSDLFTFGTILYEMVTGRLPFRGETYTDTLSAILRDQPVPASRINAKVPPDLERIIDRCLEKDPERRYQSARDLRADLELLRAPAPLLGVLLRLARPRLWPMAFAGMVAGLLAVAAWLNVGGWRDGLLGRTSPARIGSLAVLPLANLSGDPEQNYFADGMTDALINNLARIGSLRVISRNSVMRYKEKPKTVPVVARELNVDAVVEASVLRSGERVRINATLISAATEDVLWAGSYERDLRDILALQGEVARAIAREVRLKLTPEETTRLERSRPVDPRAHDAYLKARYSLYKYTHGGFQTGIEHFKRAIELDPGYAPAWAGLAETYWGLSNSELPPTEAMPRAKAAALKALEIDGTLPEAHAVLGLVRTVFEYDWQGAESEFQKAIELSPGLANAHHWYGLQLVAVGRFEEARAQLDRANSLDPLSAIIAVNAVWPDYYARRYSTAIKRLRTILQAEPEFHSAHGLLGWAHEQLGQYSDAIAELKKGTLLFDNPEMTAYLAHAYAMSGQTEEAHRLLEELLALRQRRFVPSYDFGTIHLALGEKDRAVEWLRTAYQERSEALTWVQVDPKMDALRADPGYQAVVRLMGLSGNREMRSGPRFPERVPTAGRGSARDGRDTGGKRREAGKKLMPSRSGTSFTGLPCWGKTICSPGFPQCTGRI